MTMSNLFTSESVSEGHPDKLCDQISDAILDACLAQDPYSRVAVETMAKGETVILSGEVTSGAEVNLEAIVRQTVREIGYTYVDDPFHGDSIEIINLLTGQGGEIADAVDAEGEDAQGVTDGEVSLDTLGAGDQGLMFGYATNETSELMPLPILLAHKLVRRLADGRRGDHTWLRPDAKSLVTVEYEDDTPRAVDTVLVSTQHDEDVDQEFIMEYVRDELAPRVLANWFSPEIEVIVNPSGSFKEGGPSVDAGLTGRKLQVDTYGGAAPHGGGAFSGKDPTKVDRSAAYFARFVARSIVEAELADRAVLQVSYGIGLPDNISLYVNTFGTGDDRVALEFARQFDYRPGKIIDRLNLLRPIYRKTATYGHFGKPELSWEQTAAEVGA